MWPIAPMFSSIVGILQSKFDESIKEFFKPKSSVLAFIFLMLNFLFVLPVLRDYGIAAVIAFEAYPPYWQIILGIIVLIALGYVIDKLQGFFLSLASGSGFRESLVGKLLKKYQERNRNNYVDILKAYAAKPDDPKLKKEASVASLKLALEYPERDAIEPFLLGNILNSVSTYTWNQYGAHFDVIWPILDDQLQNDDKLRTRLMTSFDALLFLTSMTILFIVTAFEITLVRLMYGPSLQAVWAFFFITFAYVFYFAAIQIARDWSRDVRLAFDLYLDKVREKLNLKDIRGYQKEKDVIDRWKNISRWLRFGHIDYLNKEGVKLNFLSQETEWYFDKKETPKVIPTEPKITYPPTLSVQVDHREIVSNKEGIFIDEGGKIATFVHREVRYLIAITNQDDAENPQAARGGFLLIEDERIPALPDTVKVPGFEGHRLKSGQSQPEVLYWDLGTIYVKESCVLVYTLKYQLSVEVINARIDGTNSTFDSTTGRVQVGLSSNTSEDIVVKITAMNKDQLPSYLLAGENLNNNEGEIIEEDGVRVYKKWKIPHTTKGLLFTYKRL